MNSMTWIFTAVRALGEMTVVVCKESGNKTRKGEPALQLILQSISFHTQIFTDSHSQESWDMHWNLGYDILLQPLNSACITFFPHMT